MERTFTLKLRESTSFIVWFLSAFLIFSETCFAALFGHSPSCESLWVRSSEVSERQSSPDSFINEDIEKLRLKTARLEIRPVVESEYRELFEAVTHPLVGPKMGPTLPRTFEQMQKELVESKTTLSGFLANHPVSTELGLFHDRRFVGSVVATHFKVDAGYDAGEITGKMKSIYAIGYFVKPQFQRQGFVTEGVSRVIRLLFEEGHAATVYASVFPTNTASRGVLKKQGFVPYSENEDGMLVHRLDRTQWLRQESASMKATPLWPAEDFTRLKLVTPRLTLRMAGAEHIEDIFKLWSDPRVQGTFSRGKYDLKFVQRHIRHAAKSLEALDESGYLELAVFRGDEFIGTRGVIKENAGAPDAKTHPRYEVSAAIRPEFQNQGFATESLDRLVRYLFEQGRAVQISAFVVEDNGASAAVLKKSGFREIKSRHYGLRHFVLDRPR